MCVCVCVCVCEGGGRYIIRKTTMGIKVCRGDKTFRYNNIMLVYSVVVNILYSYSFIFLTQDY